MSEQPEGIIKQQTQTEAPDTDSGALVDDTVVLVDDTSVFVGSITAINPTLQVSVTPDKPKGR